MVFSAATSKGAALLSWRVLRDPLEHAKGYRCIAFTSCATGRYMLVHPPSCCLFVLCILYLSLAFRQQQDGALSPAMAPAPSGPPPRASVLTCLLLGDDRRTRGVVGRGGNRGHCDPTHDYGPLLSNHGGTPPPTKPSRFASAGFCRVLFFHNHLGLRVGAT